MPRNCKARRRKTKTGTGKRYSSLCAKQAYFLFCLMLIKMKYLFNKERIYGLKSQDLSIFLWEILYQDVSGHEMKSHWTLGLVPWDTCTKKATRIIYCFFTSKGAPAPPFQADQEKLSLKLTPKVFSQLQSSFSWGCYWEVCLYRIMWLLCGCLERYTVQDVYFQN